MTAQAGPRRLLRWLVTPPDFPPFRDGSFGSRTHDPAPAAWLGIALGVAFGICFVTGLLSHLIQSGGSLVAHDVVSGGGWRAWPTAGGQLYRVTQGLHVTSGIAAFPLLFAKLFVVYPQLFTWPPVRGVRHAVERASLPLLIGGSIFMLLTGVQNVMYWYPWGFFFPVGHYWAAWVTTGALIAHIGAKASISAAVARRGLPTAAAEPPTAGSAGESRGSATDAPATAPAGAVRTLPPDGGLTRRTVLTATAAVSGVAVAASVGGTIRPLAPLAVLNARNPTIGPQGFPVNKTAASARVEDAATADDYRLRVTGADEPLTLSRSDLLDLPQRDAVLPIACVEGWSAVKRWRGVSVATLLERAGARQGSRVRVVSLQSVGFYRSSDLTPELAAHPDTLLALKVGDEDLHLDHGFPVRLIAPNNPGVLQTKWVGEVRIL
ncbi:MAG TPA: molybdopterin-dependent oxidoreductase [Euzebyales bacterium]